METNFVDVSILLTSIGLIIFTILKFKLHPFLALLLASFFVGVAMKMPLLDMVNAIENGIGSTLGSLLQSLHWLPFSAK